MNQESLFLTENYNNIVIKKEEEQMEYTKNHISNIIKVFEDILKNIDKFKEHHSFSVNEKEKEESKEEFELAWKHHYTVNPHHPEYWIKDGTPQPMPMKYIIEMACDWIAMCVTKGGTALQYLIDNREKKQKVMHQNTMEILERFLIVYYK